MKTPLGIHAEKINFHSVAEVLRYGNKNKNLDGNKPSSFKA